MQPWDVIDACRMHSRTKVDPMTQLAVSLGCFSAASLSQASSRSSSPARRQPECGGKLWHSFNPWPRGGPLETCNYALSATLGASQRRQSLHRKHRFSAVHRPALCKRYPSSDLTPARTWLRALQGFARVCHPSISTCLSEYWLESLLRSSPGGNRVAVARCGAE